MLRPGGAVFAATPFLQAYHGYPSHFQNFTVTGHQHLFQSRGFRIREAGPCVGPVNAWITLNAVFLRQYLPRPLGAVLAAALAGAHRAAAPAGPAPDGRAQRLRVRLHDLCGRGKAGNRLNTRGN